MLKYTLPLVLLLSATSAGRAIEPPDWLPRYDLDIRLDPKSRLVHVKQLATFTNRHQRPAHEIVFNAHGRYTIPDGQVGLMAKMAEYLRVAPKEALPREGPALEVTAIRQAPNAANRKNAELTPCEFRYGVANPCSIEVPLDKPVGPGETVTLELEFTFHIPAKKGRWSQWEGITALAQWLPTFAVYDEQGWHALPFIPWHQPFYNEAGIYTVRIALPCDQKLACPCAVREQRDLGDGVTEYRLEPAVLRDFSLTCSARYQITECNAGRVKVRCFHLAEHAAFAAEYARITCKALPMYERWFGPYPYSQFIIAEACFGWNGNECSGMVLIDDRMFNMPQMAKNYPLYLVQHELCHQWWYNVVGTNGYAETFMDEAMATYFSHRLSDETLGKNNPILDYPKGLKWLPNIHRDDLRNYGAVGARARGDILPTVQPVDQYGHLPNLLAHTYDRGSKVIAQIEQRMGETAFIDFIRGVYRKYAFRILRVADFQRELEEYTGHSWEAFFRHWIWGSGMCDWRLDQVEINGENGPLCRWKHRNKGAVTVVVDLVEEGGFPENTVLGVRLGDGECCEIRFPINPNVPRLELPEQNAVIETRVVGHDKTGCPKIGARVTFTAACVPKQIVIDPDHVLLDCRPDNNAWNAHVRFRVTPIYTQLEEMDVTNSYDRWNLIFGPWIWTSTQKDPWFSRSPIAGMKLGVYRTQALNAGVFMGYRANDRNLIAGGDVIWDHVPLPRTQLGMTIEKNLTSLDGEPDPSRGVLWGRYIFTYGSSLYLPPFEYIEAFGQAQYHPLPNPRQPIPGADPFQQRNSVGMHYHMNYLTPYWDAEGGLAFDVTYQYGVPMCGQQSEFHMVHGQVSTVKYFPEVLTAGHDGPVASWLKDTRIAVRAGGGAASPRNGLFYSLSGGDAFRGFDLRERQGSFMWVASAEWRLPIVQNVHWDFCDKVFGVQNIYLAPFYDVGQAYLNNQGIGDVAHAAGLGLRVDVHWLGLIERTMVRFDVARTINDDTPWQFWFGIQHPF